jgi:DNA mismatch repair protein MutL
VRSPRIKVMPDWLKNQIAAGEVVERPASVIKELVENAMDAGATRITIEIEQGGQRRIRVVDNGTGMTREEAELALERHATSKCTSIDDLRNIGTFGFRGEALPSIASVSHFTLRTRTADEAAGTLVATLEGGGLRTEETAMPTGTEVCVDDLFFNVPARRKFLKAESTEQRTIVEVVQRMAISNHHVHFELTADGRRLLTAPPEPDRMARIFAILGRKVCDHLYECFVDGRIVVRGFISQPGLSKRGATGLFTFVNGRFVRDKLIIQAVLNGYGTLLGRGVYPYAVLDIAVPPNELDVNVHPAKSEVRFQRANEVFAAIARAVRITVSEAPWVGERLSSGDAPEPASVPMPGGRDPAFLRRGPFAPSPFPSRTSGGTPDVAPVPPAPAEGLAFGRRTPRGFANMRYLGQFANCYLLGQIGSSLVIIDQHAAHERVMFERLREQFKERGVPTQPVLVPQLLELEPALVAAVEDRAELLERLGFHLEPFGGNTVAVKSVPTLLGRRSAEPAVRAVLEELSDADDQVDAGSLFHKPISTMACHMAVRAGDPMDPEEVHALLRQMDEVDLAAYCPHGRPVVTFLSEEEVARWFNRG